MYQVEIKNNNGKYSVDLVLWDKNGYGTAFGKYFGDDGLFDDLYDAGKKDGPKADARPVIRGWMDREFVDSWKKYRIETTTILNRIGQKIQERKNG